MAPVQFGDFSNSITDLFDRSGFGADKKIKSTFKTPPVCGGAITVSEEVKGLDDFSGGFSAAVSAKWKHACGFSVDKFDNSIKKGTILETSFNKFSVPGLAMSVNLNKCGGKTTFPLQVKFENDVVATSLSSCAPDFASVTANVTLAAEGLMVGSSLEFKGGSMSPKDYPISLAYKKSGYNAACEATNELKTFTLLGSYAASDQLTVASKVMIPDGDKDAVSLVGVYKLNDAYNSKAACMYSHASGFGKKGDKAKTVEVALVAKPLKGVEAGCALGFPLGDLGAYTYGFNFTLG